MNGESSCLGVVLRERDGSDSPNNYLQIMLLNFIYGSSTSLKSHEQLNLTVYTRTNIKGWVLQMMGNLASVVDASNIYHRASKLTTSSIVTVGVALVLKCKTYLYSSNCWNEVRIG